MAGPRQSKRVSWAPAVNLCQVRLFLSEDAPSQSGLGAQDHLQAKASWLLHATGMGSDDSIPPGFEARHPSYQHKPDISLIPLIKWKCPSRIVLNPEWVVVAGEESEELAVENRRQLGVLEAIYPRLSVIPATPFVSSEVQNSYYDDSQTPLIPIIPIEDEDTSEQQLETPIPIDASIQFHQPDIQKKLADIGTPRVLPALRPAMEHSLKNAVPQAPTLPPGETPAIGAVLSAEPDVVAAAAAAFTAIMKSSEEGSLIDPDLLITILNNPIMMEKLVAEYGVPKQAQLPMASVSAPPSLRARSTASAPPLPRPHVNFTTPVPLSNERTPPMYPMPNVVPPQALNRQPSPVTAIPANFSSGAPPVKDINYYKSLIQQHGGEKQETLDRNPLQCASYNSNFLGVNGLNIVRHGSMQKDVKPKIPKPCAYFNTPKGCKHGASCLYQHDSSISRRVEQPRGSKRIKLDRGLAGGN
ncbi:zinc finger CCCH domain-containing protein 30 [Phoenix dactylifera]|uniref:Zinc finger CCCH domain-containing protein 30 n=1 Tax=Phoenix dactylifera TaxID=42345 RepID=A0A8B7MSI9_PHODC|nr:zinc finger CCCH domain-containing protein 30 [Phoenix dactylifera]